MKIARGCPAAALRIWTAPDTEQAPIELCGDKSPGEVWHYISSGQNARISFITTDKTIGAQVKLISNGKMLHLMNAFNHHNKYIMMCCK